VGTPIDVLYLYDAVDDKQPLVLPCRNVVFTALNRDHFKEFIKTESFRYRMHFMPLWMGDEIAVYEASSTLRRCVSLEDCRKLFQKWGGLPGQTFELYERGCLALTKAIKRCGSEACIKFLEAGFFLSLKHLGQKFTIALKFAVV
jgi:hypothetical protein